MAKDLNQGQRITLTDGTYVCIHRKIGEGGQGAVYMVKDQDGNYFALKWYTDSTLINNPDFYRNLANNIRIGSPSSDFLWPLKLAERQNGSYGYVMELLPEGYHELGHFFRVSLHPDAKFASRQAQIRAALFIVNGFRRLHMKGFTYKDLNDGNFFINPKNGKTLICDNDNVTANNIDGDIGGKARYMAAEIVNNRRSPNIDSDFFSLAIILYRIFMTDHPFEGRRTLVPCVTEEVGKQIYGDDMVFCWDVTTDINRPDRDNHKGSMYNWSHSPESLRRIFIRALSREAVRNPMARVKELEWKNTLLKLRANLIICPSGNHDILADENTTNCPRCGRNLERSNIPRIHFHDFAYLISPKKIFYLEDSLSPIGIGTLIDNGTKTEIGIENLSGEIWMLQTPSGRVMQIPSGEKFPLRDGMQIVFNGHTRCRVTF